MGYRNNPLMEPEFFTPPGSKRLYKGGGGGQPYYENQDKLFGTQADIATNLYNQYAAYAPQVLGGLSSMVQDAQSGQYTRDQRNRAESDALSAAAQQRAATERSLQSMGVNPNDPRFVGSLRATELGNAANVAAMKNAAGQRGEDMAWARSQDFYNSLAGVPSQSASMLASAGTGYGQMGAQQQAQANANMQGYGQFGAQIAGGMFKADGGYIDEPRFALGGAVGGASMPKLGDWRARPSGFKQYEMSTMDKVGAVAAPIAAQAGANALAKHVIGPMADQAGSWAAEKGADALVSMFGTRAQDFAAPVVEKGFQAVGEQAAQKGAEVAAEQVAEKGAEAVAAEAAGQAVPGVGQVVGIGSNLAQGDYAGAALNLIPGGNYIDMAKDFFFAADGGAVPHRGLRIDMRAGGSTPNIGTETSDSIPAWLSKGEYVINADAVEEVGRDKLEKINERGLKKRYGAKAGKAKAKAMKRGKA